MPEHKLPDGQRWIGGLLRLGRALEYAAEPEFDVATAGSEVAPVDVAWLGSANDRFPLFIFEVESTPSGQMTYNAAKVFGQESDLFEKPLFHFHLVLKGGARSGRLDAAAALFGKFNYRVYRISAGEATQALCDILSQHRRVRSTIDIIDLAAALPPASWPEVDFELFWRHVESCDFTARWGRDYARLALEDKRFVPRFARVIRAEVEGTRVIDGAEYDSFLGYHASAFLHAAIVAQEIPVLGPLCLQSLEGLQGEGSNRVLVPRYGASEDYDGFLFSFMPSTWALVAASLRNCEGARRWVLDQMQLVIDPGARVPSVLSTLTAVWMLHVAAGGREGTEQYFQAAANALNKAGGVPRAMLAKPPMVGGSIYDLDSWHDQLAEDPQPITGVEQIGASLDCTSEVDLTEIALRFLLEETPPDASAMLVSALR